MEPMPGDRDASAPGRALEAPGWHLLLGPFVALLTFAVQSPALRSGFMHDDFLHFYMSYSLPFGKFLFRPFAGHIMAVHNFVYWGLLRLFRLDATRFFGLVVLTHAANAVLFYVLLRRLTGRPVLAAFLGALWGIAPVHINTLAWFACYGQVQAVFFLLVALVGVAGHAARREAPSVPTVAGWTLLLLLAAASFGLGVALALVFPFAAALLLPAESRPRQTCVRLLPLPVLTVVAYVLLHRQVIVIQARHSAPLAHLMDLLQGTTTAFVKLVAYGSATIFAGPLLTINGVYQVNSPLGPMTPDDAVRYAFLVFVPFVLVLGASLWKAPRTFVGQVAGVLLLAAAAYGIVAYARGTMLVSITFITAQARYHYGQTIMLATAAGLALSRIRWRFLETGTRGPLVAAGLLGTAVVPSGKLAEHMTDGFERGTEDVVEVTEAELHEMAAMRPEGSVVLVDNTRFTALELLYRLGVEHWLFPDMAGYFVITRGPEGTVDGRKFLFVEKDAALVKLIRETNVPEVARLFVTADEAEELGGEVERSTPACLYVPALALAMKDAIKEVLLSDALKEGMEECRPGPYLSTSLKQELQSNPALQAKLRDELRNSKDPRVREKMLAALKKDPAARVALARALERDPAVRAEMQAALRKDPAARLAMQAALEADPNARKELERVLRDDPSARREMEKALAEDPDARAELARALSRDANLRAEMERALAEDPKLRTEMERALRDDPATGDEMERELRKPRPAGSAAAPSR